MRLLFSLLFLIFNFSINAQNGLISGPWAGNVELRNATIWLEVNSEVKSVTVEYKKPQGVSITKNYTGVLGKEFNPVKIDLNDLDINTTYTYDILIDGNRIKPGFKTKFTTKDLWQYRKPAPDFNFLTGSCSYFNETKYDRPGKPYGMDSTIFITMAETPASFNLWLGDSWYTREVDFNSPWGLNYRVSRDRSMKVMQPFMASMPHYFIWDDHDYGPNNSGKSYILKEESREIFKNYTLNPSYGEEQKGIYTKMSYSDVDFFMTDNRYFRSEVYMADSINGKSNPDKTYFGRDQMNWLKNALLYSNATFKIIATGSQVLNEVSTRDCMRFYSYEFNELMNFIAQHNIKGILFLTGDRHHSEIIKKDRPGYYPLYDITVSPLTASVGIARDMEKNNPGRVAGTLIEAQNFASISVTGRKDARMLKVEYIGLKGEKLGEWSIQQTELINK